MVLSIFICKKCSFLNININKTLVMIKLKSMIVIILVLVNYVFVVYIFLNASMFKLNLKQGFRKLAMIKIGGHAEQRAQKGLSFFLW